MTKSGFFWQNAFAVLNHILEKSQNLKNSLIEKEFVLNDFSHLDLTCLLFLVKTVTWIETWNKILENYKCQIYKCKCWMKIWQGNGVFLNLKTCSRLSFFPDFWWCQQNTLKARVDFLMFPLLRQVDWAWTYSKDWFWAHFLEDRF